MLFSFNLFSSFLPARCLPRTRTGEKTCRLSRESIHFSGIMFCLLFPSSSIRCVDLRRRSPGHSGSSLHRQCTAVLGVVSVVNNSALVLFICVASSVPLSPAARPSSASPFSLNHSFSASIFQKNLSNATQVVLRNVGFGISGNFSCEVTVEAPSFSTLTAGAQLLVVGECKQEICFYFYSFIYFFSRRGNVYCDSSFGFVLSATLCDVRFGFAGALLTLNLVAACARNNEMSEHFRRQIMCWGYRRRQCYEFLHLNSLLFSKQVLGEAAGSAALAARTGSAAARTFARM